MERAGKPVLPNGENQTTVGNGNPSEVLLTNENGEFVQFTNGFSLFHNNHYSPFYVKDVRYRSLEQYIAAMRCLYFKDYVSYEGVMLEKTARRYKDYRVEGYDHFKWRKVAGDLMFQGLLEKFRQSEKAKLKLLETGNAAIIYATEYDRVLGTGLPMDNKRNLYKSTWEGLNELGFMLADIREALRK